MTGGPCACAESEEGWVYWTQWTPRRLERARMGVGASFEDEVEGKPEAMSQVCALFGMMVWYGVV